MSGEKDEIKNMIDNIIPTKASDEPKKIYESNKKLYSIILIVVVALLLVSNLLAIVFAFIQSVIGGLIALLVGSINMVVAIFLICLVITVAQNISRITKATLEIKEKIVKDKENE